MEVVRLLDVRDSPLSVDEVLAAVADPGAGGSCVFVGVVRDVDHGRQVAKLGYSAHPTVAQVLRRVADGVVADVQLIGLAAVHRVGDLGVGDLAVVVAASARHRAAAFDGCRRMIDDLKREVPIWKHQLFIDGDEEWVGSP